MPVCGFDEIAARVAIELGSPELNVQTVINDIWKLQEQFPSVLVHSVSAAFGTVDIEVTVKTKTFKAPDGFHPTWRIAKFVEALHNVNHVTGTQTEILVHDPQHDERDTARQKKYQPAYDGWWAKATATK